VQAFNRLEARWYPRGPGWNAPFCRAVRAAVDVPVLCEGGIRERSHCDRLLGTSGDPPTCDAVGLGRPFYAEPRLPARLLAGEERVLCESCNNCTIPQAAGEPGRCRTPSVVRERARRNAAGEYERDAGADQ
jgi:2,4-dienoyl-CoA reductase-like NADH-dependent reductase (Old Yellow Enzyme family)